jgi:hypothetical protein
MILLTAFPQRVETIEKGNTMSDELTVSNPCYQCMIQMELCVDCQDLRDSRATNIAHDIVDEGNLVYPKQWHSVTEPSGHEWVSATTRVEPYFVYATQTWEDTREEFLEPITNLSDRFFELVVDLGPHEMVCQDCRMVCNKHAVCPSCN